MRVLVGISQIPCRNIFLHCVSSNFPLYVANVGQPSQWNLFKLDYHKHSIQQQSTDLLKALCLQPLSQPVDCLVLALLHLEHNPVHKPTPVSRSLGLSMTLSDSHTTLLSMVAGGDMEYRMSYIF